MFTTNRMRDLAGEISFLAERGQGSTAEFQRLTAVYEAARKEQLADEIVAQHAAMLERCDIAIIELDLPVPHCDGLVRHYGVYQGVDCLDLFTDDDEAMTFAVEQANEQIQAEMI